MYAAALDTVTCVTVTSWFAGLDARAVRGRRTGSEGEGKVGQLMLETYSQSLVILPVDLFAGPALLCSRGCRPACALPVYLL